MSASNRRTVSCIRSFYLLAVIACLAPLQAFAQSPTVSASIAKADELYRHRDDLASARQAADLYDKQSAISYEAAWKLSRAAYWLATAGTEKEQKAARDRGVKAGEQAIALDRTKPEGHFWLAANLGEVAENASFLTAWKYPGRIKDELETVLKMDPAWQQGSADRALGEWYFKVPGVKGGDHKKAEEHLRAALKYNPQSTATLYFLAEVIADDGTRTQEALPLLQQVADAPLDPDWTPEDKQFKEKAKALQAKLGKNKR
jgi:tetratricopeptide (TPR) repeat protein